MASGLSQRYALNKVKARRVFGAGLCYTLIEPRYVIPFLGGHNELLFIIFI